MFAIIKPYFENETSTKVSEIEHNSTGMKQEQINYLIEIKNQTATIVGPKKLIGTEVVATDLRAGAAMVAAGLKAEGKTTITNAEHILRGYELQHTRRPFPRSLQEDMSLRIKRIFMLSSYIK